MFQVYNRCEAVVKWEADAREKRPRVSKSEFCILSSVQLLMCPSLPLLQDDTVVAGAAERALLNFFRASPAALSCLLSGSSSASEVLAQVCSGSSSSSTQSMRAFSLLIQAAAGSSSLAEQLKHAGEEHSSQLQHLYMWCGG